MTATGREENKDARLELIQSILLTRSTQDWLERLEAQDVPCAPVLTRREMIRHPQIAANGIIVETEHPVAGPLRHTRNAAQFSETSPEHRHGAPLLGQQTVEVLQEAGHIETTDR